MDNEILAEFNREKSRIIRFYKFINKTKIVSEFEREIIKILVYENKVLKQKAINDAYFKYHFYNN